MRPDGDRALTPTVNATIDYVPEGPSQPAARRVQIRLAGSTEQEDLRSVLRRRLLFLATLGVIVYAYFVAIWGFAPRHPQPPYHFWEFKPRDWSFFLLVHGTFVGELFAFVVLWRYPASSLRQLRLIELGIVSLPVLDLIRYEALLLFAGRQLLEFVASEGPYRNMAWSQVFPWFLLIVAYGVTVPNTSRRSALVMTLLSLAALALNVTAAVRDEVLGRPSVQLYLVEMALWLGYGTAIVVFNAYRIEVLWAGTATARQLGQYRLGRRLGAGGMGEVYLAQHILLRRPCALKLIRPERAGDAANLRRFEREVQTTATLTHPNTVQIYDYGHADDGTFYYVMEYLPGLSLEQLVGRYGPLAPGRVVHLLVQLCGALREAHAIGLVHRDIKPGNVMVCERGGVPDTAKLLDFGLVLPLGAAADGEKLTQVGAVAGTPAYMSPEQAGGQEELGPASDIYSVGALAYFLLTGRPPFAGRAPVQVLAAHLYEQPEPLSARRPDTPADLEAVVLRCLAKNPTVRFEDVERLESALAACRGVDPWSAKAAAVWWEKTKGTHLFS
jgi:serine/threonine-protein kinase